MHFKIRNVIRMLINPIKNLAKYLNEHLREANKIRHHTWEKVFNQTGNQENIN